MPLNTQPNLADADGVYEALVAAHQGLGAEASAALNARLVLLLANHVGDAAVIGQAIVAAQGAQGKARNGTGDGAQ